MKLGGKIATTSAGVRWPEVGDFVVGTVIQITPYGAYVSLDEYNIKEGLLHISEISSTWVKNIRDHVREGQKVVLKVLRVNPQSGHVDLSLRRVTERERREKLLSWKRLKKSEAILKMAAEKVGANSEEISETRSNIEASYGDLYSGLEEALYKGKEALLKAGVQENLTKALLDIAKAKIKAARVKVRGVFRLSCTKPDGVNALRNAFRLAKDVKTSKDGDFRIYVLGPPRYRIEVSARNYKEAERILEDVSQAVMNGINASGGEGSFKREG